MEPGARDYLEELTVTDVAAHTLGISIFEQAEGRERAVMAAAAAAEHARCRSCRRAHLLHDAARRNDIIVPVLEGESAEPELCRRVGVVAIDKLPPGRPPHQPVNVTMSLNTDGILQVSAVDVSTATEASTTIEHSYLAAGGDSAADEAVRALVVE